MKTAEQIVATWTARKKQCGPSHMAGQQIRRIYNGEEQVALPELNESERSAIANLIQTGLDQHAMRIASVIPATMCPPIRNSRSGRQRAEDRRNTIMAWHYLNKLPLALRYRARYLIGYASSPVYMRFGKDGYPVWDVKDPLATFPGPSMKHELVPPDCIFSGRMSYATLLRNYGVKALRALSTGKDTDMDTMYDVLWYVDAEQIAMVACGKEVPIMGKNEASHAMLYDTPNRTEIPLVVVPGRVTLDRLQGQFDQMVGMYRAQAELWALQMHAIRRGIFPETYAQFNDTQNGEYTEADPYAGKIGEIYGGTMVQFRPDPGFASLNAIDRLEGAQRATGAVPQEFGGEGSTNVRTGRRGAQVLSAAVDFPVQEHQEILAASLEEENRIAIALAKAYAGNVQKTFNIPYVRGPITYTPNKTFDTDAQFVSYAYAGADTNSLVIEGGQRIGLGTLSKDSFMEIDPLVKDKEGEKDKMVLEGLQVAHLAAIQQQAADPAGPWGPVQLARLEELVYDENIPLYKAVQRVQEETQNTQQQAQEGQLPPEQMQPGIMPAGAPGAPDAGAAVQQPGPSMQNLSQLIQQLGVTGRGAQR